MIFTFVASLFATVLGVMLNFLPTVLTLPFGLDQIFVTAIGYWNSFLSEVWILQAPWTVFLYYAQIKVGLIFARFLLGSRLPVL